MLLQCLYTEVPSPNEQNITHGSGIDFLYSFSPCFWIYQPGDIVNGAV